MSITGQEQKHDSYVRISYLSSSCLQFLFYHNAGNIGRFSSVSRRRTPSVRHDWFVLGSTGFLGQGQINKRGSLYAHLSILKAFLILSREYEHSEYNAFFLNWCLDKFIWKEMQEDWMICWNSKRPNMEKEKASPLHTRERYFTFVDSKNQESEIITISEVNLLSCL